MKNAMKHITSAALAATLSLGLMACGGNNAQSESQTPQPSASKAPTAAESKTPEASSQPASTGEDVTIKITWWGGQSRHDYTQQLLDLYSQENPKVHFEAIPAGWDGYFDKLSTQAASGSLPDIMQMDYLYISTYAKNGTLADLNEFVDSGIIDVSNIDSKLLKSGEMYDRLAGLVLSNSIIAVGYNPDALAKADVTIPENWTWSQFADVNKAVAEKTGQPSAILNPTLDTNIFNYWVRQHGGTLYNDAGTGLGYDDDQIMADFIQECKDMMDAGIMPNPDEMSQIDTLGQEASPVVTGDAATIFEWNNYASKLSGVNGNLHVTMPPVTDDGKSGLWIKPGMFFSIAENSTVKEECAKFINWFVNSEEANDIIMAERGTPVSSAIRKYMSDSGKLNAQQIEMFGYVDKAAAVAGETPAPDPVGVAEVGKAYADAVNAAIYDQLTPMDAAKQFRNEATAILEKNNQ